MWLRLPAVKLSVGRADFLLPSRRKAGKVQRKAIFCPTISIEQIDYYSIPND